MVENSKVGLKLTGFFRGEVVSHLPCGRCKIWIPDVFPEEWKNEESDVLKDVYDQNLKGAKIPDAEQATTLFGGATSSSGSFSYPKIGSTVWCFFEREDIQHPVYFAATIDTRDMAAKNSFPEATILTDNGNNQKHVIKCGKSKLIMEEDGTITLKNGSLASIVLGPGDEIDINAKNILLYGDVLTVNSDNSITLRAQNSLELQAYFLDGRHTGKTLLSSVGSFQIHDKEYNNNFYWNTWFPNINNMGVNR